MVPSSEADETNRHSNQKGRASTSRMELNAERDTEEYRKLRERNNEAVKKSRTRTKLRTQATLEKVEKLRNENSSLEERIEGMKKELDLLKELFLSHAGTKSLKKLTEVDLGVLLAEAAPANKRKRGGAPYAGRSPEVIEREVQALLKQEEDGDDEAEEEDDDDLARPSTSHADQMDNSNSSLACDTSQSSNILDPELQAVENIPIQDLNAVVDQHQEVAIGESFAIIEDGSNASIWATETGESVVVTISDDGQAVVTTAGVAVQQDLHATFIEGELLMLE